MTISAPKLTVATSTIHGMGAFVTEALPQGALVGIYEGRRYSPKQLARLDVDHQLTYLFSLSNGYTIDGGRGGNATRHINHSCDPNCEAVEVHDARGRLTVQIRTLKPLQPGDEAFLDYRLAIDESFDASDYPCSCRSACCRGTLIDTGTA